MVQPDMQKNMCSNINKNMSPERGKDGITVFKPVILGTKVDQNCLDPEREHVPRREFRLLNDFFWGAEEWCTKGFM